MHISIFITHIEIEIRINYFIVTYDTNLYFDTFITVYNYIQI